MSMYDYIRCEYPLPGSPPAWLGEFQTKDLGCYMDHYTITEDGRLTGGDFSDFTGTISFYDNNVVASGPGIYTRNGEDAQWVEYRAVFVDGKLAKIKEIENRSQRAIKFEPRRYPELTPEDLKRIQDRRAESLIGKTMWLWWGSLNPEHKGYPVTVVIENDEEWIVQAKDGNFEKVDRYQRDNCLFDSYADAKSHNDERKADWEREKREYEVAIQSNV